MQAYLPCHRSIGHPRADTTSLSADSSMTHQHTALWIDHREAKIFRIDAEGFELSKLGGPHHHLTRKSDEQGNHGDPHGFYRALSAMLDTTDALLVVGPS